MFNGRVVGGSGGAPEDRDPVLTDALRALDPSVERAQYWFEFRRTVLLAAGPELARRRRMAEMTVSEVVFSWSRALVPAAVAAAAAAVFLAHRADAGQGVASLRLEQMLWEGVDVSAGDSRAALEVEITFAAEVF